MRIFLPEEKAKSRVVAIYPTTPIAKVLHKGGRVYIEGKIPVR